ncbi:nicotinate-nucleotide pyrophosphorylase, partial [Vibrio parahaemolyticus AQ3810]
MLGWSPRSGNSYDPSVLERLDASQDITASLIPADAMNTATIITREHGVFCGQAWADEVFKQLGGKVTIEWHVKDGDKVEPNQTLCTLTGPARDLLTGERNAMNFIQTLSGCATTTAEYAAKITHTDCRLLDTRKTIPGLRSALKYAVACGGGFNHRIGVFDAYLIKENHIIACGGITQAITTAKEVNPGNRGLLLLNYMKHRSKSENINQIFVLTTHSLHWFREQGFYEVGV